VLQRKYFWRVRKDGYTINTVRKYVNVVLTDYEKIDVLINCAEILKNSVLPV